MLQRKVAALEAERYSKQSIIESLESRVDTLDKDMEATCQQLQESKREMERIHSEHERDVEKKEEALREALREKEATEMMVERERKKAENIKHEVSQLLERSRDVEILEIKLSEATRASKTHKEEVSSLQSKADTLVRRLASADEHIAKMAALLKEKDHDAERGRSRYQEQQAMIERQEHELNGMRIQYESHMKRMQMQRQELDKFKTAHFSSHHVSGRSRGSHHHDLAGDPADGLQDAHDDQIAFLRSELNRSMQREKSLIMNIRDRDRKLENAEKYLGNMDKVVSTLSKYG